MAGFRDNYISELPNGAYYSRYCNESSSESSNSCWDGSTLRTNFIDPVKTRALILNIFLAINILIPLFGTLYIKKINQHLLLKNKPIKLTHLVPWQSVASALSFVYQTGRLPAGSLAFMMLITGVLHISGTNVISALVTSGQRGGRCAFPNGLIFSSDNPSDVPSATWPSSKTALDAQSISMNHVFYDLNEERRARGILEKASSHHSFYTSEENILGWWTCNNDSNLQSTASEALTVVLDPNRDAAQVLLDLGAAGVLNPVNLTDPLTGLNAVLSQIIYETSDVNDADTPFSVFAWTPRVSGSDPWSKGQPWDVSIAVGTVSLTGTNSLTLVPMHCSVQGASQQSLARIEEVLRKMYPVASLSAFTDTVSGALSARENSADDWMVQLELYLDAMVMVSASGNIEQDNSDASTLFGCVIPDTKIGVPVFIFVAIQITVLLVLCCMVVYQCIAVRSKCSNAQMIDIADMPNDIVSLQLAFVRDLEGDKDGIIKSKTLRDYHLDWNANKDQLVFKKPSNDMTDGGESADRAGHEAKFPEVYTKGFNDR